jgi:hypothetical protein
MAWLNPVPLSGFRRGRALGCNVLALLLAPLLPTHEHLKRFSQSLVGAGARECPNCGVVEYAVCNQGSAVKALDGSFDEVRVCGSV